MRRVTRRMQVCRTHTLSGYADYLMVTPEEAKELFSDLLISVTMFFRDARAFDALQRHAIQPILEDVEALGDDGVRAWVVGCATGEEAYSIAILFAEEAERRKIHVPIQIFATDLDEGALATAREGRYPKSIVADVSEERLARFFVDEGSHYSVRKEIRETVLFAHHSVLKEPPFMRLDLISCRNLLIYLERSLQQQVCGVFHYGLEPSRFLFLGSAETADTAAELFTPLDREARVYAAKPTVSHALPILPQFPSPERLRIQRSSPHPSYDLGARPAELHVRALERGAPPSVLVDSAQNIIHMSETAGRFILHSAGPISSRLATVVRPELRLDLRLALARALDEQLPALTHSTPVAFDGERRRVSMHVVPVPTDERTGAQALVYFLDSGPADGEDFGEEEEGRPEAVRRLHGELKSLQEALVASRSGHDATIQDLRAANEELQSTNEEYRSTAEELETSREELQSINEELRTVNAELKSKLEGISSAHNDLQNLTAATEIGTLFLDADLRIRMFTPPITDLFNIAKNDVGRVITDFTKRIDYDGLAEDANRVLRELAPLEREVRSAADHWYVMRLRPYRTVENRINGVVLTFVDITQRLLAEAALSRSEQEFRALVEASSQVVYRMSPGWDRMHRLFGGGPAFGHRGAERDLGRPLHSRGRAGHRPLSGPEGGGHQDPLRPGAPGRAGGRDGGLGPLPCHPDPRRGWRNRRMVRLGHGRDLAPARRDGAARQRGAHAGPDRGRPPACLACPGRGALDLVQPAVGSLHGSAGGPEPRPRLDGGDPPRRPRPRALGLARSVRPAAVRSRVPHPGRRDL